MRSAGILAATLAAFLLLENLVFNTGSYAKVIDPDSSTGRLELMLWNEQKRPRSGPQVLAIGDSRMGFFPRYADQIKGELNGLTFATISTPGTTPRDWYYMLRAADPQADRYAAILIPMYDYDDAETWEDHADREQDLHYLIARLRWTDLFQFAGSYRSPRLKFRAALGILLKGTVYKTDFQDFLLHRRARLSYTALARRDASNWYYDYTGTNDSLAAVAVDWKAKTVHFPSGAPASEQQELHDALFGPQPTTHRYGTYLKYWLGKIYGRYRGTRTRIIFFRLPRGPFVRPDPPPYNPSSSVRELAQHPEVILDDEHYFDFLERPDLFTDPFHLNGPGCAKFSRALARHVRDLLAEHAL